MRRSPARGIEGHINEAAAGACDLIVMSSRGLGLQHDRLRYLGSVTEHLIRRVAVPVLVVPDKYEDEED
jgi:nucleotide-binding universal stress UspA family protein